jgi:DNA polymerase-3 subunit beta
LNDSEFESTFEDEFRILIPLKTAQEIVRLLKKNVPVKLFKDENQLLVTTQDFEFISRLIDGAFPDYQAIIPKDFGAELTMESAELTNALKLAGVFTSAAPEIILKTEGKGVEIFSRDEKLGENHSRVAAKMKGEFKEVNFNWKYLLDGIRACASKEIVLRLSEENRPALMQARDDGSFFYIVMPILKS